MADNQEEKCMYMSGETPPDGNYACAECSDNNPAAHIVPDMGKKLPDCPKCKRKTQWVKF